MLDRSRMLREYRTDVPGMFVCVEVAYAKSIYYGPRGYWLHIYQCEAKGSMRIIPLGKGSRRLIATAGRLTKKGMDDAAWTAEGLLMRDDPEIRKQIAEYGNIRVEEVMA